MWKTWINFTRSSSLGWKWEFGDRQLDWTLKWQKQVWFHLAPRNHSLSCPSTTYTKTIDQDLVWNDFEQFYALITSSQQLETYAFHIYHDLSYFLKSWKKYKQFKHISYKAITHTPKMWRLGPRGFRSWCCWMCLVGGEVDWRTSQAKTKDNVPPSSR